MYFKGGNTCSFRRNLMALLSLFNFITFFLFLALLLTSVKERRNLEKANSLKKIPPGPRKLSFLGNLHNLMMSSLPHHHLRDLARKYGPLIQLQLGEVSAVVISSPRLSKEIMKTRDLTFASRPRLQALWFISYGGLDLVASPYCEYWRQMRKICVQELLSAKNVSSFGSIRHEEYSRLVSSIHSHGEKPINFTVNVSQCTSAMVNRAAFGNACKDRKTFTHLVKTVLAAAGGFGLADLFPSCNRILGVLTGTNLKLSRMRRKMDAILDSIIDQHIQNLATAKEASHQEDLIDVLVRVRDSSNFPISLTNNHIKAILFDIFAGGTESSSLSVDWAMSEMLRHPHIMAKAQSEIREAIKGKKTVEEDDIPRFKYLKLVIKESLRLHPPLPLLLPRECREDCEIDGYHIPKGTKVIINAWANGRDADYWSDPESFIPERFEDSTTDYKGNDFEYTPFGAGRRICPGMTFGLANIELPLALLLYHFDWKLPAGLKPQDLDMQEAPGLETPRKNHLWVVATPYDIPKLLK